MSGQSSSNATAEIVAKRNMKSAAEVKMELAFMWSLLVMSLALLSFGVFLLLKPLNLTAVGQTTSGRVVDVYVDHTRSSGQPQTTIQPIIAFTDPQGVDHRFISQYHLDGDELGIGSPVEVIFDPKEPQTAEINNFQGLWLWPLLSIAFGASLALSSVLGIRMSRRRLQRLAPSNPG